jgi:hypothetical protein
MRRLCLWVTSVLTALAILGGCGTRMLPAPPADLAGLPMQPGRYVKESYLAPDFQADEVSYTLGAFTAAGADRTPADAFLKIFQDELARAFKAQGLKLAAGKDACLVTGTIEDLAVRGTRLRWLTGRVHAALALSGTITRGGQVLFAFRDQVSVSSPLAPGPPAPREQELLLRQLARESIHHLLNELLLQGIREESGAKSAMTRK